MPIVQIQDPRLRYLVVQPIIRLVSANNPFREPTTNGSANNPFREPTTRLPYLVVQPKIFLVSNTIFSKRTIIKFSMSQRFLLKYIFQWFSSIWMQFGRLKNQSLTCVLNSFWLDVEVKVVIVVQCLYVCVWWLYQLCKVVILISFRNFN